MDYGIITAEPDSSDGRRVTYLLTEKGIDLAPVLAEMVLWAAAREKTGNQALVRQMRQDCTVKFRPDGRRFGFVSNLLPTFDD